MNYSDNVDFYLHVNETHLQIIKKKVTGFLSLIEFFYSYFFQELIL